MNNKLVAGLVGLAALTVACGSGPEVASDSGPADSVAADKARAPIAVKMGQKLTVNDSVLAATYTLSKARVETRDKYDSKAEHGAYLVAFLRVDVTKGETFACACELSLVQNDGKVREQAYASFDGAPKFASADLKAGQNTDGWVVWDLPADEINGSKVQLKISSLFADSEYGYWTVKV